MAFQGREMLAHKVPAQLEAEVVAQAVQAAVIVIQPMEEMANKAVSPGMQSGTAAAGADRAVAVGSQPVA